MWEAASFHRAFFRSSGATYGLLRRLPRGRAVDPGECVADEIMAAGVLQLGAYASLIRPLVSGVGASDASPFACGSV